MSISVVSIKCPDCGANLDVEQGRRMYFCSYCGTKIAVINDNEFTFHEIDESKIEKEKAHKDIELAKIQRKIELEKLKNERREQRHEFVLLILGVLLVILIWTFAIVAYLYT